MKKILLLTFVAIFLLSAVSVHASNLKCGTGSIGTCPTVGNECAGVSATCSYISCTCVVTSSQTIDNNALYSFDNLTIVSGVTVTSIGAAGGVGAGVAGSNGFGVAAGGNGGVGGYVYIPGGNYSGGGGAANYNHAGGGGGNYSGGGGGSVGNGGNAGGIVNISADRITIAGTINVTGSSGGNDSMSAGGGGGGGNIFLYGNSIIITGVLNASGGPGGAQTSGNGASGGGGGGGVINITYACSYTAGTYSVAGGAAGSSAMGSYGGNGTNGTIVVTLNRPTLLRFFSNSLNITLLNQTGSAIPNANVNYYESGTSNPICNGTTDSNGFFDLDLPTGGSYLNKIYDINITTSSYQQNITYKAARIPANISVYGNMKWVPESTLSASKLFTAGHIVPVEIHILAPWSNYSVANISLQGSVPSTASIVSNILFEKDNSTGDYTCDVLPTNSTYYYVDKTSCSFLNSLNVTTGEWIKVSYRLRLEGPSTYTSIGQQKTYTLPTAYLRFDAVTS